MGWDTKTFEGNDGGYSGSDVVISRRSAVGKGDRRRGADLGRSVLGHDMVVAGAGPATVENALSVLRQILEMAVEDKCILRNPCAGVKGPRRQHRARGYLTHDQVELLASELSDYGTVVRFLAYSGLRWGEMAALRVDAIDMLRRRVDGILRPPSNGSPLRCLDSR